MVTEWNGKQYEQAIRAGVVRALYKIGYKMEEDTKRKMAGQQGPSRPGGVPAVDTGRLINSLYVEVNPDELSMRFGSTIKDPPYPFFLEVGTIRMSPRPWLRPELALIRPEAIPAIRDEMRGILK